MDLNKWFEKGLTPDQYMESLEKHKENFLHIHENFTLPDDDSFIESLKGKNLRVIALAEVWCGHCMLNIPILLRIAERTETAVRFLPRDSNLELMDQYLTNEKRIIPIFIFIDENGNEVAKWGPMAEKTRQFVDQYKKDLPSKDAEGYDEKFRVMIKATTKEFRENPELWNGVYESIKETIDSI